MQPASILNHCSWYLEAILGNCLPLLQNITHNCFENTKLSWHNCIRSLSFFVDAKSMWKILFAGTVCLEMGTWYYHLSVCKRINWADLFSLPIKTDIIVNLPSNIACVENIGFSRHGLFYISLFQLKTLFTQPHCKTKICGGGATVFRIKVRQHLMNQSAQSRCIKTLLWLVGMNLICMSKF